MPDHRSRVPRTVVRWGGIALVVVAVAFALLGAGPDGWSVTAPDPGSDTEVALTDGDSEEPIEPRGEVDPQTAARLRALIDPSALRCAPRGCEVWRVSLEAGGRPAGAGEGLVAVAEPSRDGPELRVIDAGSGEEVFRSLRPWSIANVTFTDDSVVVFADTEITALDLEGIPRWSHPLPPDQRMWWAERIGDRLIGVVEDAVGADPAGDREQVPQYRVLDASDGSTVWEAEGHLVGHDEQVAALIGPSDVGYRVRAHDLRDGMLLWEHPAVRPVAMSKWMPDAPALLPIVRTAEDGGDVLVELRTGAEIVELDGGIVTAAAGANGETFVLIDRGARTLDVHPNDPLHGERVDGSSDLVVLAVRAGGEVAWRTPVRTELAGYAHFSELHGQTLTLTSEGGAAIEFDLASGLATELQPASSQREWSTTDSLGRHLTYSEGRLRIASDAGHVAVTGENLWMVSEDPVVVAGHDSLLGLELVPAP